jgi:hypothetical protein
MKKKILNILSINFINIYLFGDNLRILFDYFCNDKNEEQLTIKLKNIIDCLKEITLNLLMIF